MLDRATRSIRSLRPLAVLLLGLALAAASVAAPAEADDTASGAASGLDGSETRTVSFRGVRVDVPADWPVRRMAGEPGCVRFDRRAVYVGDPSRVTCPADLVGRTQAVHLTTRGTQGVALPDRVVTSTDSPVSVVVSAGDEPALARDIASTVTYQDATANVIAPDSVSDARALAGSTAATTTTTTAAATTAAATTAATTRRRRPAAARCRTPPSPGRASTPAPPAH